MNIDKAQTIIEAVEEENKEINTADNTDNKQTNNKQETNNNNTKSSLDNLVPFGSNKDTRSVEQVREYNRLGGIKSGETRRKRKTARELLDKMLQSNLTNEQIDEILGNASNILAGDNSVYNVMLAKMVQQSMAGDTKAFIAIRDTAGEKPIEQSVTLTDSMTEDDRKQIDKMRKQLMDISKIS